MALGCRKAGYDLSGEDHYNPASSDFLAQASKPQLGPDGKPCRTCTDFRSWMKSAESRSDSSNLSISEEQMAYVERDLRGCPLDKDELGRATWKFLHTMAANYPEKPTDSEQKKLTSFLNLFGHLYPCGPCADDFRVDLVQNPPKVTSSDEFSTWLCHAHNRVNVKVGKPKFDCSKVMERWRDGWRDGSCD
eukprot:maker-scaffold227_size249015-snap-gene-1.26 protein:Tk04438 transcript:maker-scaffold227_size249015-snap-gene-1.26-mRNA-1 annotation:"fad-linked sulfhydryl oxidase alr"